MIKQKSAIKGYISGKSQDAYTPSFKRMNEAFTGEVNDKKVKFPKELGVEHPFEFEDCEKVYEKFGLMNGAINKIADSIVGEFSVNCENPKIQKLVDDFIEDSNFSVILREWIREGLMKGNGFMEIDINEGKAKVLNANNMYVVRDSKGNVTDYNQYTGDFKNFNPRSRKLIPFKPDKIAHIKFNALAGAAYGLGIIWPNERVIENMIMGEQDSHKLTSRKAGAPIHVSVGMPGENADKTAIDDFKTNLQYMNNKTEWVTDANVKMDVLQFGEIGKNLMDQWNADFRELIAGIDIPEVLLNSGQLNEGIATAQVQGWQRRIISYQDMIENIIITYVIKPFLKMQGINGKVDFVWNLPGTEEINLRVAQIQTLLASMSLSENMRRMLELELSRLLDLPDAIKYLRQPEAGLDDQKEAEKKNMGIGLTPEGKPIPENPTPVKPDVKSPEKAKEMKEPLPKVPGQACKHVLQEKYGELSVKEFIDLKEVKGFNYSDYLVSILGVLKEDGFTDLKATSDNDIQSGLLPETDIEKLRTILKEGFKNNLSMDDIANRIKESISLKDRIYEKTVIVDGKEQTIQATLPASNRPELIARTEVVRVANIGLKDLFDVNNVKEIRWIAAYSDRTCDACAGLDGQVVKISESFNSPELGQISLPPAHVNCRCSIISE